MAEQFRIGDLAAKAGVTKRTIHYYINRGLLPPAHGTGIMSTYSEDHLLRIMLIKKLQEKYLPLERIRNIVAELDTSGVRSLLEQEEKGAQAAAYPAMVSEAVEPSAYRAKYSAGTCYVKYQLGAGVELLCPKDLSDRERAAVMNILAYAKRVLSGIKEARLDV